MFKMYRSMKYHDVNRIHAQRTPYKSHGYISTESKN